MAKKHIIFVPGKSPKPQAKLHKEQLWRTLQEGVRRADPESDIDKYEKVFYLVAWNYRYYQDNKDIAEDLPWIDSLLTQDGPTQQDIRESNSWQRYLYRFLYTVVDSLPWLIHWLPEHVKSTIEETNAYFHNYGNIGYEIRGMLKDILRPLLDKNDSILVIGHSLGSVIIFDTLWELSHNEVHKGKVDFLSIGSPLGLKFVQNKLQGHRYPNKNKFPANIKHWVNISSVGDMTAVDKNFNDDYYEMLKYGLVESIEDHSEKIYNFYHNNDGLDCHSSYGYLVNTAVGKVISKWWKE